MKLCGLISFSFVALQVLAPLTGACAQDSAETSYAVFDSSGASASWNDLAIAIETADVILVGEQHNDSIGHLVELRIFKTAHHARDGRPAGLSLEMFDLDVQFVVDEYLGSFISDEHFRKSARAWDNYADDYAPLVELAKSNGLPVLAANVPRRYVNRVTRDGVESLRYLPESSQRFLPPLPVASPTDRYRTKWMEEMAEAMGHTTTDANAASPDSTAGDAAETPADSGYAAHGGFDMGRMLEAQNLWDAGMAHRIASFLTNHPATRLVHMVGSFHVRENSGLPDHLRRYRPSARQLIVVIEPVDDIGSFDPELNGAGDFVILTPEPESVK